MKKLISVLLLAVVCSWCYPEEAEELPVLDDAKNSAEIKKMIDDNKLSVFDGYDKLSVYVNNGMSVYKESLDYVINEMKVRGDKLAADGKYEDALLYYNSYLTVTGRRDDELIKSTLEKLSARLAADKADRYTQAFYKDMLASNGFMSLENVVSVLKNLFNEKRYGEFFYYADKYSKIYKGIESSQELINMARSIDKDYEIDFEDLMKSVVTIVQDKGLSIKNGMGGPDKTLGTGFFIDDDGYILTNYHVISAKVDPKYKGYAEIYVTTRDNPDEEMVAKVVGYDRVYDLALIKVPFKNKNHLKLGMSRDLRIGDKIYTIGNPLGLKYTVTSGIISNREIEVFQMGRGYQVDAAINPGNSGGPLIDSRGDVVGVVFAGVPVSYAQGISFAIPFEWIVQTVPLLYKGGEVKRSWIGAGIINGKNGVEIYYVMPDGGAANGGLKEGDILSEIDSIPIKTQAQAQSVLAWKRAGSIISVKVKRGKDDVNCIVKLSERPFVPLETVFRKDSESSLMKLIFGMKLDLVKKGLGFNNYKIEKIYKGLLGNQLEVFEGDPFTIYSMRYVEKEKVVSLSVKYTNKKVNLMERFMTIAVPAEINTIL